MFLIKQSEMWTIRLMSFWAWNHSSMSNMIYMLLWNGGLNWFDVLLLSFQLRTSAAWGCPRRPRTSTSSWTTCSCPCSTATWTSCPTPGPSRLLSRAAWQGSRRQRRRKSTTAILTTTWTRKSRASLARWDGTSISSVFFFFPIFPSPLFFNVVFKN